MDIEQILTQILIAFFTVIFFIFASRVKSNIEKRYRKGTEDLKHSKEKMKEISVKQTILCKKVLCESTNRHHRSIIAASLKQTLDEEMEKLEHIKDSIKLVQQIPDLKPSFQQFDRDFFSNFGDVSGSNEANGDKHEKYLVKGKDGRLQTKMCNAWRAQSRRYIQSDSGKVKKESKKKWNDFKDRHIVNFQFPQLTDKQIQALNNFTVNNVHIINFKDNHIKTKKDTLEKTTEVEAFKNGNYTVKSLSGLNSGNFENKQDIARTFSLDDLFTSEIGKKIINCTTKSSLCSFPDTFNYHNNKTKNNYSDVNSESIFIKDHKTENQLFIEKGISSRHIRHETKKGKNRVFKFDFTYCSGKEPGVKIMIEHTNNKSVIYCDAVEENLKVVDIKMFQVSTKKGGSSTLVRCVFKISLKINKKKVVLKCVISCFDKEKRYYKQLGYRTKQIKSNTNCCRVQSKHKSINRKQQQKKHSLYTNTHLIPTEERKRQHSDNTYHSTSLAEGEITLKFLDHKHKVEGFIPHDSRIYNLNFQDEENDVDQAILNQCVQLTRNCFTDNSELFYADAPLPMHSQIHENEVLATIEEEAAGDGKECFEKIKVKICPTIQFETENFQLQHKVQRQKETIDRNGSVQQLPLFFEESNRYDDESKIQSDIQTTSNFEASQFLETINSIRLNNGNSPSPNISQAPTTLTCVYELRSYDEPTYLQNIFMNSLYDEILNKEGFSNVQNIFQNRKPAPMICSASCTSIKNKDQNEESQMVEYSETLFDLDTIVLGRTATEHSLFMKETIFLDNESEEFLYFNTQNTTSGMVIMEGAVFSSSDNSNTVIWNESESQTDLSFDKLSNTSELI